MIIHGAKNNTSPTLCGKSLKRVWWVPSRPYKTQQELGFGLVGYKTVDQRHEINCRACRAKLPKRFR